jgi:hypothetical protein
MKVYILPGTALGKWSIWLIVGFIVLFGSFWLMVATGQRGGEGFFDNLLLTVPVLLAAAAAIASFITGLVSLIKYRERSILIYPAMAIGLFVLIFVVGEIAVPH